MPDDATTAATRMNNDADALTPVGNTAAAEKKELALREEQKRPQKR